eukprot:363974-Chlamydomonas_euryale.AAC.5
MPRTTTTTTLVLGLHVQPTSQVGMPQKHPAEKSLHQGPIQPLAARSTQKRLRLQHTCFARLITKWLRSAAVALAACGCWLPAPPLINSNSVSTAGSSAS